MRNMLKRILSATLCLCLLGGLTACNNGQQESPEESSTALVQEEETVAFMDGYRPVTNIEAYREALSADSKDYLLLVNKQHPLGSSYEPSSLSEVDESLRPETSDGKKKSVPLEPTVAKAAEAMVKELHALGYTDILITSGYRSYTSQNWFFNEYYPSLEMSEISPEAIAYFGSEYIQTHYTDQGKTGLSEEDARKVVSSYSSPPGYSEHQSGLCLDLISTKTGALDERFADLPAYDWLEENAHCFGFILRYPKGMENITGYSYEPWHYRFVGVEAATAIHNGNLTLEAYVGQAD